ncbi:hypothetical protein [Bradyrhizobium sp. BWC-3-1]|uniref:hypothetical protein n=1 Tax=Bradyrhizobium sp. BWC-3-1 TaxID=3080012 RepID=UPI00293EC7BD|nr:hypothetical protein [Bradyrhizobium sp. BWC-3-1]WOH59932.1 hypothetical protein RX329_07355 [Bradyrhizobium sp. BWC-3-1]
MDANLFIFYRTDDLEAAQNAAFLVEGGKPVELQQGWSYRADPAHVMGMQNHVHIMLKKNDVSIINRDGTQSHGTSRDKVPNWVIDKIKARGLIESAYIIEASTAPPILVPEFTIGTALAHYHIALAARR